MARESLYLYQTVLLHKVLIWIVRGAPQKKMCGVSLKNTYRTLILVENLVWILKQEIQKHGVPFKIHTRKGKGKGVSKLDPLPELYQATCFQYGGYLEDPPQKFPMMYIYNLYKAVGSHRWHDWPNMDITMFGQWRRWVFILFNGVLSLTLRIPKIFAPTQNGQNWSFTFSSHWLQWGYELYSCSRKLC